MTLYQFILLGALAAFINALIAIRERNEWRFWWNFLILVALCAA